MTTFVRRWRYTIALAVFWLAVLPIALAGNWLQGHYGGAHYPAAFIVILWLGLGGGFALITAEEIRRHRS